MNPNFGTIIWNVMHEPLTEDLRSVIATDIKEIASEYLTKTPTLALVGPFKSESKFEKVLAKGAH